ncbi:MAG: DUF1573 domain-containing protein [Planctomycetota bacterium]|nr:DUF1573 domain-containing protein [Planctomycetota bacterium]
MLSGCQPDPVSLLKTPAPKEQGATSTDITIAHDFGVVAPNSLNVHRYPIENKSSTPWTPKVVKVSCTCTAPSMSSNVFLPGETNWVEVEYRAASKSADDLRDIAVVFHEPEAPTIKLVVQAAIRSPITAVPAELNFGDLREGKQATRYVEITNWSRQPWTNLVADSESPWLQVDLQRIEAPSAGDLAEAGEEVDSARTPTEVWRATVAIEIGKLADSTQTAQIFLRTSESELRLDADDWLAVPVVARRIPSIRLIPGDLHFGIVRPGEPRVQAVRVVFADTFEGAEEIQLVSNLENDLDVQWTRTAGRIWEFHATLKAGGAEGAIEGEVLLMKEGMSVARMPVSGLIRQSTAGVH